MSIQIRFTQSMCIHTNLSIRLIRLQRSSNITNSGDRMLIASYTGPYTWDGCLPKSQSTDSSFSQVHHQYAQMAEHAWLCLWAEGNLSCGQRKKILHVKNQMTKSLFLPEAPRPPKHKTMNWSKSLGQLLNCVWQTFGCKRYSVVSPMECPAQHSDPTVSRILW